jgi:two-component system alkaline phosphatase synthesis response regulator PhoP
MDSTAGGSRTVLVVDDDPDLRETMQRQLEAFGFRVVLAADGREGLAEVARSQPDVVLCDLTMPVMDGLEFGRRLRANPQHRRVFLIAVTGRNRERDIVETWRVGFDRLVGKPVTGNTLAQLIRSRQI